LIPVTASSTSGVVLSMRMLVHVMGYVFEETQSHLQSCISLDFALPLPTAPAVAAAKVELAPLVTKANAGGTSNGRPKQEPAQHDQEQLMPTLALVSHALALAVTPVPQLGSSSSTGAMDAEARQLLQVALARLDLVAAEATGGCEWLDSYCDFLQRRHLARQPSAIMTHAEEGPWHRRSLPGSQLQPHHMY
jgi:hypothetical protein